MLEIKLIDQEHQADIRLKNEPFSLWGKILPTYNEGNWQYTICKFAPEDIQTMRFPDENYCYDEMNRNSLFIGAYDDGKCIGLAIIQDAFFKYLYLYDLKVNTDYRQQGVGQLLIQQALKAALAKGYRGIYTQAQDNNPSACLFYLRAGFRIGGLDTEVYKGTNQEGKSDILFYLDAAETAGKK
ncbi:GNAT family N-acetyltransferase [Enterococcus innesii]|uniref:GNAT family N-acetyltransferase n=1 Tax=Enterococcus innesii TaxID=2839759 RepID=UPI003B59532E